jgi:hypothetical protein
MRVLCHLYATHDVVCCGCAQVVYGISGSGRSPWCTKSFPVPILVLTVSKFPYSGSPPPKTRTQPPPPPPTPHTITLCRPITGFLGSGKTTALNQILSCQGQADIALSHAPPLTTPCAGYHRLSGQWQDHPVGTRCCHASNKADLALNHVAPPHHPLCRSSLASWAVARPPC